jgi:hypothetical protein
MVTTMVTTCPGTALIAVAKDVWVKGELTMLTPLGGVPPVAEK